MFAILLILIWELKRVANTTRKQWFWVLRHLLHTSTPDSGKFQAKPLFFSLSLSLSLSLFFLEKKE